MKTGWATILFFICAKLQGNGISSQYGKICIKMMGILDTE